MREIALAAPQFSPNAILRHNQDSTFIGLAYSEGLCQGIYEMNEAEGVYRNNSSLDRFPSKEHNHHAVVRPLATSGLLPFNEVTSNLHDFSLPLNSTRLAYHQESFTYR